MKIVERKYLCPLLVFICIVLICGAVWAQTQAPVAAPNPTAQAIPIAGQTAVQAPSSSSSPGSSQQMTPQQAAAYQKLSPAQQQVMQQELGKTGGQITPQAVEALKGRPEFKGLSPEDVAKGKLSLHLRGRGP